MASFFYLPVWMQWTLHGELNVMTVDGGGGAMMAIKVHPFCFSSSFSRRNNRYDHQNGGQTANKSLGSSSSFSPLDVGRASVIVSFSFHHHFSLVHFE